VPLPDSPGERETLGQLKAETQDFWETTLPALRWDTEQRATQARAWLRERVFPKRQLIVSISERVQGLNRAAYDEQQSELGRIYSAMRRRVWETSVAVLLLGIGIAFIVIGYAGRLEAKIREQRLRDRENTQNLQRLSAKLVNAQEEERRSIARELHDEIGQALTAIKVELAVAERALDAQARARNLLGEARAITDHALQTVRDLSQLLHPPLIDDLGLAATLDWFLSSFSKRTGVAAELLREGADQRLAPGLEMCLYRITQEALTNVAKHAEAMSCVVRLERLSETVRLTVEDNGKGFDVQQVMARHLRSGLGLLGVQERVSEFAGTFTIDSKPGHGTRLVVELPAEQVESASAVNGEPVREPASTGEVQ
jgi:signal transduction histidine kinase